MANSTSGTDAKPGDNAWERDVIQRIATEFLRERRRARRWGIFFKLTAVAAIVALLFMYGAEQPGPMAGRHTAVVQLDGVIGTDADIDADTVIAGLQAAFDHKNVAGIILKANSPGGSPVQSAYINDEIRRLREAYPKIPLFTVVTDICASGCYYAAAASDKIFADKGSIVGSIGVLIDSFGFVEAMDKLGIERRLLTAGRFKGLLDPFSPLEPAASRHAQALLNEIHRQFIDTVKAGRGDRLGPDEDIFSGLFWTGERALELGLVDELGSAGYVAREVIGAEEMVDYTPEEDLFNRLADRIGAAIARTLGTRLLGGPAGLR